VALGVPVPERRLLGVGELDGTVEALGVGTAFVVGRLRAPALELLDASLALGEVLADSEIVGVTEIDGHTVGSAEGSAVTDGEGVGHGSVGVLVGVLVGSSVVGSVGTTVTVTVGVGVLSVGSGSEALGEPSFGSGCASVGVEEGSGVGLAEDVGFELDFVGSCSCSWLLVAVVAAALGAVVVAVVGSTLGSETTGLGMVGLVVWP
jgi:hypothetical protein